MSGLPLARLPLWLAEAATEGCLEAKSVLWCMADDDDLPRTCEIWPLKSWTTWPCDAFPSRRSVTLAGTGRGVHWAFVLDQSSRLVEGETPSSTRTMTCASDQGRAVVVRQCLFAYVKWSAHGALGRGRAADAWRGERRARQRVRFGGAGRSGQLQPVVVQDEGLVQRIKTIPVSVVLMLAPSDRPLAAPDPRTAKKIAQELRSPHPNA